MTLIVQKIKKIVRHLFWIINNREKYRYRIAFENLYSQYNKSPRYQAHTIKFDSYLLEVPDITSVIWQFKDVFVDESFKYVTQKKNPVIYDCGSNVGVTILYFKKLFPNAHIKSFEADVNIVKYLKRNIENNNASANVEIISKAVWVNNDHIEFGSEGADGGSLFLKSNVSKVECVRLKDYIAKEVEIDFLKMDIEGAEGEVIVDCREVLSKVKRLYIEYHSYKNKKQELDKILSILTENSFRYYLTNVDHKSNDYYGNAQNNSMNINIYAVNASIN